MLQKNQIYDAEIVDYTSEGQGIAKIEGCAVFIPNAIVGESCQVCIEKTGKTWAAGKMTLLTKRSPHRVNRACPHAKLCGGCDFWHMDYEEELRLKAERVRQALNRIGGEALENVEILGAPQQDCYRNKAQYPVALEKGKAVAGFYRAGTHQVVQQSRCRILPEQTDLAKSVVLDFMNQRRITAYDEKTHKGLVRHIYVRCGAATGQVLVCLVVNGRRLPHHEQLAAQLAQRVPGFTSLVLGVNERPGNAVLGETFVNLWGPGYIEDELCGLHFRLSPRSFYQVNHAQAERLYNLAIEAAGISKQDTVLDLCCGAGTITLCMASAAKRVIGVEIVPQAVEDAKANASRNGIENAEFICADVSDAGAMLLEKGVFPDVVTLDPPRKGLAPAVLEAVAQMAPRKIVYISCDPATLARDVALLKCGGYQLAYVKAVDLFPRCAHVETVVMLSHKKPDSVINVKVEFGEGEGKVPLDNIAKRAAAYKPKERVTYKMIKEYIEAKYGFKVHTAYIAEVKRELGLPMYDAPNAVEELKQPRKHPTPEKVEAIKDALRYFEII